MRFGLIKLLAVAVAIPLAEPVVFKARATRALARLRPAIAPRSLYSGKPNLRPNLRAHRCTYTGSFRYHFDLSDMSAIAMAVGAGSADLRPGTVPDDLA